MALHYRDEEVIYVQASSDRVTVIFSTMFREETDRVFGKVFLQVRIPAHFILEDIKCDMSCRNSSTPGGYLPSKLRRRSCTPPANLLLKSGT